MPPKVAITDIKPGLSLPGKISNLEDLTVDTTIFQYNEYQNDYTTFKHITFKGALIFEDVSLSYGVLFEDCDFEDVVSFKNITVDKYDQVLTPDSESILFNNCRFNCKVSFVGNRSKLQRSLKFEHCNIQEGLEIDSLTIELESLHLSNCSINVKLDIFRSFIKQEIRLASNRIYSFLRIESVHSGSLLFLKENVVNDSILVDNCLFQQGLTFNDGTYNQDVYFSLIRTEGHGLAIINSTFQKSFNIKIHSRKEKPDEGINKFYIASSKFTDGLYLLGIEDLFADPPKIEEIRLDVSPLLSGTLHFNDLDIGILSLSGYNTLSKISFNHVLINQLKMKSFINEGALIFSSIRASFRDWTELTHPHLLRGSALYIDNSNFGKAQFFQSNFASFDKVVLTNVILSEISTSLVTWFTPVQLEDSEIKSEKNRLDNAKKLKDKKGVKNARKMLIYTLNSKREIYRQLKFVAQKQGDIPLSLDFQRHEMNYYRQVVKANRPRQWSEHLILYTNQSNNFGQTWIKAFLLLVVFSFISYIPICILTSPQLDYHQPASSLEDVLYNLNVVFYSNIKEWLIILNPTHRITDINQHIEGFSGWIQLWDLLSRIIVSYFIFQVVSAFRKFSK